MTRPTRHLFARHSSQGETVQVASPLHLIASKFIKTGESEKDETGTDRERGVHELVWWVTYCRNPMSGGRLMCIRPHSSESRSAPIGSCLHLK